MNKENNHKVKFSELPKGVRKIIMERKRRAKVYQRWLKSGKRDFYKPVWLKTHHKKKKMSAKNKNLQSSTSMQYSTPASVVFVPMGGQNKRY